MSDKISKMADMLRAGAAMLSITCPQCNTPLFKYKGEIYCANCDRIVKIVKDNEAIRVEEERVEPNQLSELESIILNKVKNLSIIMQQEKDLDSLERVIKQLILLIDLLEKIRRIEKI
ncbi:MAG: Sjogren's syndrome/scleroderma autoantigen 1 family protein [Nitrososphaerota archaeon]